MNRQIIDAIPEIVSELVQNKIVDKSAFLGFDACIDNIVRIVKDKKDNVITGYFPSSSQFGDFLKNTGDKSCGVELQTKLSKIGGNMVITANALGNLGISVECAGTFGMPEILPVFRTMSSNCTLFTIGETISATALEFDNSKVIMFDPGPYISLTWESIKEVLGTERMIELLSGKQLISFLNWSEIENSSQIWKGIIDEILPDIELTGQKAFFFTDFSDCSRKSKHEIKYALDLLGRFRNYFKVILSLNQNEADLLADAIDIQKSDSDETLARQLFSACNTDILIIHRTRDAIAYDGAGFELCESFFCKEPMILTGGGDNFNAGFCYSQFHDFSLFQSLLVANAVSGSYVKTGISPDVGNLIKFLEQNIESHK